MIFFGRDECDFSRCLSIRSADFIQWPSVRGLSPLCSSERIRLVRLLTTFHEPQASESKRWSIFTMNKRGRSKCSLCREEELTANGVGFLFEVMKFLKLTGCGCALPVNKLRTAELYTWDGWTVWCEFHLNKAVFKKWRESRKEKATYSTSKMKGILDSHQAPSSLSEEDTATYILSGEENASGVPASANHHTHLSLLVLPASGFSVSRLLRVSPCLLSPHIINSPLTWLPGTQF